MSTPFKFEVFGEIVELQISEKTRRIEHTITKEEATKLKQYEEDKSRYSWCNKPQIRKWDYMFTGKLSFAIVTGYHAKCHESIAAASRSLTEKEHIGFDELLARVLHLTCQACAEMRKQRQQETEEARLREIKVQEAREQVERYNAEAAKLACALEEAKRHRESSLLRDYAEALRKKGEEWQSEADWLHAKADWIDPLVASCDPILGKLSPKDYPPSTKPLPTELDIFPRTYRSWY